MEPLYSALLNGAEVCTDTRKLKQGDLFFALKGPNFDGNKFAIKALENGAQFAVVDDAAIAHQDERLILVEDSLKALQQFARYHRDQLNIPIIGLTGSNGKTTTKELIHAVLSTTYKTLATTGNLNNHIGVPLTILSIKKGHEFAIIEMGANFVGDIAGLCEIANPSHGMITNIGKAHLEGFGGFEGVIRGKSELYQHLISNDGQVWINSNNEILYNMAKRFKNPIFYPQKGDYYHCELAAAEPFVQVKTEEGAHLNTHLTGAYNFENIAAALCIGKYFDVPADRRNSAIEGYVPKNNRSQIIEKESNLIFMDAYNANPTSMAAAIENFKQEQKPKKVVILGDMKELGVASAHEHGTIGKLIAKSNFDNVFLYGPEMKAAQQHVPNGQHFVDKEKLHAAIRNARLHNCQILIKGSRSMALETVLDVL